MDALLSRLAKFGLGLAVAGGIVNSALYNGMQLIGKNVKLVICVRPYKSSFSLGVIAKNTKNFCRAYINFLNRLMPRIM